MTKPENRDEMNINKQKSTELKKTRNQTNSSATCRKRKPGVETRVGNSLIRSDRSDQMSDCERFAQISPNKWATVRKSLRLLMTNERLWAICSGRSTKMSEWAKNPSFFWAIRAFAHYSLIFLCKNDRFAQKTDEQIPNPGRNPPLFSLFIHRKFVCLQYLLFYYLVSETISFCIQLYYVLKFCLHFE